MRRLGLPRYSVFELLRPHERSTYPQSIVFGNGWEMTLRFADLRVTLAEPIYPVAGTVLVPVSETAIARSARMWVLSGFGAGLFSVPLFRFSPSGN